MRTLCHLWELWASLGPFILFWTIMMVAMMFPTLAPTVAARYQRQSQQVGDKRAFLHMLIFLLGYLLIWALFGGPAFLLAWLGEHLVLHAPALAIGQGFSCFC